MNGMRKLACLLFGIALAAFALPSIAQVDKTYTFTMSNDVNGTPATITGGSTKTLYALFDNAGPPGSNSSFNSTQISGAAGFKITSATPDSGRVAISCTGSGTATQCTVNVTKTSPVLVSSPIFKVAMTVQSLLTETSCPGSNTLWGSTASTGSGNSNQNFSYSSTETNAMRTVQDMATCSIAINQPTDAFVSYVVSTKAFTAPNPPTVPPIMATLLINGSAASGVPVTLSSSCSGIDPASYKTTGQTTDGTGTATFGSLDFTAAGSLCTLTASASGFSSATAPATFNIIGFAGPLVCGAVTGSTGGSLNPLSGSAPAKDGSDTGFGLVRGNNAGPDAGTSNCNGAQDIPYTFMCTPPSDNSRTCVFTEDSLGQHPSVEYIVVWPPVKLADDPTADKQPCVSWGVTNPNPGPDLTVCGGDYVPGLACVTDDVNGGTAVMPTIPDLPPFNNGGVGHYTQPLRYQPGQTAMVCIAEHAFESGTGTAAGNLIYWTKFIDQSDSSGRLP
jgi:hypothetical protein